MDHTAARLISRPMRVGRGRRASLWTLVLVLAACASGGDPVPAEAPVVGGVGPVGPVTSGDRPVDRVVTLDTPDGTRSAIVHHPRNAGPGSPLVVVLHPAATPASAMQAGFGWDGVADREGFVVAYPDGLLDLYQDTWNGGGCCPPASQLGTDDVGFLEALVDRLGRYDATGSRVYAVGFSNGAVMAYAWACAAPGRLAGIGVVAGALMTGCADAPSIDVVAIHGTADPAVPAAGGPGPDGTAFPSVEASLAPFLQASDCPQTAAAGPGGSVTEWRCAGGRRVVRALVDGAGHIWPGAGPTAGTATGPLDATGFLWAQLASGP